MVAEPTVNKQLSPQQVGHYVWLYRGNIVQGLPDIAIHRGYSCKIRTAGSIIAVYNTYTSVL